MSTEPPHEKTLPFVLPYPTQVVIGKAPPPPFARRWDWWKVSTALLGVLVIAGVLFTLTRAGGLAATNAAKGSAGNPTIVAKTVRPTAIVTPTPTPAIAGVGNLIIQFSGIGATELFQSFNAAPPFTIAFMCSTGDDTPMTVYFGRSDAGGAISFSVPCDGLAHAESAEPCSDSDCGIPSSFAFLIHTISMFGAVGGGGLGSWGSWWVGVYSASSTSG